ncbi:MAG: PPC domain-containing protein [Anaerolineae bacterium]|nr:PPC domain-containing protein [Anaerolineae bacterium]
MNRIVFALLGIVLLVAAPALAQSDFGLSADDGLLLTAANTAPLGSFAFDYTAHLAVDGLDTFAMSADLSGSGAVDRAARTLGISAEGTVQLGTTRFLMVDSELRWVDDTLYLNPGDGWQAVSGVSAYAADLIYQYAALTTNPDALARWDMSAVDGVSAIVAALAGVDPAVFVSAQRLDDESVGDVPTAHFQIIVSLHELMQTGGFVEAVAAFASAQGNDLITASPDELDEIVRINSVLFENASLTIDQYVGLDDELPHRFALNLNMPLDPTVLGYADLPFTVTATLDVTLSAINQPQDITAPDDAAAVEQFAFPAPSEPDSPGAGVSHYLFFETVGASEPYDRSFEGQAGDVVSITVRGLGLDFDTLLQLFAPGGEILLENDDYEGSPFGMGYYDSQIRHFALPETGEYTIHVEELDGGAGSFVLTMSIER